MKYRILDLDNCIADDAWRIPLIDGRLEGHARFAEYHRAGLEDETGNEDLFRDTGLSLVFFTGRPVYYNARTNWWLKRKGIPAAAVFLREAPDHRSSVEVKDEMLDRFLRMGVSLADIVDAYDDRSDVVEMYRRAGIKAEQRFIHTVPYPAFTL